MVNVITKYTLAIIVIAGSVLTYLNASDALEIAMPVVVYTLAGLIIIVLLGCLYIFFEIVRTRATKLNTAREVSKAEGIKAQAEAANSRIQIITAPKGHQLVVASNRADVVYTQLHLSAEQRVNGHAVPPTDLELQTFMAYQGSGSGTERMVIDSQSVTSTPDNILNQYSNDWLQSIVLPSPHVHLCGASGSGKTMLANHILGFIKKTCPGAKFYLLNPKHTASRAPFIIDPTYKDVEQAQQGLLHFIEIMEKRRINPNFKKSSNKIVFVIDELDYIKQMKGESVSQLVNPLIKMGRELNIKVLIIGQSPLSKDTGLTQSSFFNMCRIGIWREGERLLKDNPMEKRNKAPLVSQYEDLKAMAPQHERSTGKVLRYCLVTPLNGNPSVQVIPHLEDPMTITHKQIEMPRPLAGSYDLKVCRAWYHVSNDKSPSGNKMHQLITGNDVRINGRQKQNYIQILQKYGINPGFLEKNSQIA